jgi:hypothetical protein
MCLLIGSLEAQNGPSQAADAEAHKQWMNDAADAQEDLREALAAGAGKVDGKKVAAAALKIEALMADTEAYWTAKKAADIVTLAVAARAQARDVASAATAGKFDQAAAASTKLGATCNACHDLHPEKR